MGTEGLGLEVSGWIQVLVESAAKGSVILALALVATLFMRRTSAAGRHLVWSLAACGVLLLPVALPFVPRIEIGLPVVSGFFAAAPSEGVQPTGLQTASSTPFMAEPLVVSPSSAPEPSEEASSASAAGVRSQPVALLDAPAVEPAAALQSSASQSSRDPVGWPTLLVGFWVGGVLLGLSLMLFEILHLHGLRRRATRVTDGHIFERFAAVAARLGLRRPPHLLLGDSGTIPMTWGLRRSVVLLPADADAWDPSRLEAVLTHELGHIVRRDYPAQLAAHFMRALHWFNPLAWFAANRMRVEREHACDDLVLRLGHEASSYAHELVALARSLRPTPAAVALCFARPNRLRDRLIALMDSSRDRAPLTRGTAALFGGMALALSLPVAALSAAAVEDGVDVSAETGLSIQVPDTPAVPRELAEDAPADPIDPDSPLAGDSRPNPAQPVLIQGAAGAQGVTAQPVPPLDGVPLEPALTPGLFRPQSAQTHQPQVLCGPADGRSSSHSHNSSNGLQTIDIRYGDCTSEVRIEGEIEFSEDFTAVSRMSRGSLLRIDVRRPGTRHRMEIEPGSDGRPEYDWSIQGRDTPFDAAAQAWLADALLDLFRTSGYKAEERAGWIMEQEGPDGLLAEVAQMWSDHAQGRYLRVLLSNRDLTQAQLTQAIELASREIESDHALGQVLQSAAEHQSFDRATLDDFIAASSSIDSDHTLGQVLGGALSRGDLSQEHLEALLEAATDGIESDHGMGQILMGLAQRYTLEPSLRGPFLRAARTIDSDHTKGQVYGVVLDQSGLDASELAEILGAATSIDSDHTLAQLLIAATRHDLGNEELRTAFLETANTIQSDHSRGEVLTAALALEGLTDADLAAVLRSASLIDSDHQLTSVLLEVAERRPQGPALRGAYLDAARSIESDHNLGRALEAFVRLDLDDDQMIAALDVARGIGSDHSLASLLLDITGRRSVEGPVRDAFLRALDTVGSDHQHRQVMSALDGRR